MGIPPLVHYITAEREGESAVKLSRKGQIYLITVLFLVVPLVLLGAFTYYPVIRGIILSFADYNILTGETEWVGFANYRHIFQSPHFRRFFWRALTNSFRYLMVVPFIQFGSILLAVLVNKSFPGVRLARAIYYIPVITGAVVVSIVWQLIFQERGLLNYILTRIGVISRPILWLGDPRVALYSCMFVTLWRGLGFYMVIYLAGLKNIPRELYEAAAIDGASGWHQLWYITLPLLRRSMLLCFTLSTIAALQVFEEIFLLTQGGANTSTILYEIYNLAFNRFQFSLAAALSVILALFLVVLMVINFKFFGARRKEA